MGAESVSTGYMGYAGDWLPKWDSGNSQEGESIEWLLGK